IFGFYCAPLRLLDVSRPTNHQTDFSVRQCVEILGGMDFSYRRSDFHENVGRPIQLSRVRRIRVEAKKMKGCWDDIVCGIEHIYATVPKLCQILGLKHGLPAINLAIRTKPRSRRLYIVADARRAPHVVDGMLITGIVDRQPCGDFWP